MRRFEVLPPHWPRLRARWRNNPTFFLPQLRAIKCNLLQFVMTRHRPCIVLIPSGWVRTNASFFRGLAWFMSPVLSFRAYFFLRLSSTEARQEGQRDVALRRAPSTSGDGMAA